MRKNTYPITFGDALPLIGVWLDDPEIGPILKRLQAEGHREKGICYAVWKSRVKLSEYREDKRFWGILVNEIRKHSIPAGDPRWELRKAR